MPKKLDVYIDSAECYGGVRVPPEIKVLFAFIFVLISITSIFLNDVQESAMELNRFILECQFEHKKYS